MSGSSRAHATQRCGEPSGDTSELAEPSKPSIPLLQLRPGLAYGNSGCREVLLPRSHIVEFVDFDVDQLGSFGPA